METSLTSTAAQVLISLIPIVGIVIGGVVVFFWLLWHHREVSLQIKTGIYKPRSFDVKAFVLLTGLLLTGVGFILTVMLALLEGKSYALLGGLIPLVVGVMGLVFYKINPEFKTPDAK